MKQVIDHIRARRSVRTYDKRELDPVLKDELLGYMENIKNPYGIPVHFKFMEGKAHGLSCPVTTGVDLYVGGKIMNSEKASVAFGYSFELFVLFAQSIGLGTVWLGGTMNRPAFEKAMELAEGEIMPCASPIGYTAPKMSLRETMMRKTIKADERFSFEELFYDGTFDKPLAENDAGDLLVPLEMVRLAPSAVNKQPWRLVVTPEAVHFYLKRSKGFGYDNKLDMQMIDMGIALSHFELAAKECGFNVAFEEKDPLLKVPTEEIYIASYIYHRE